MIMKKNDFIELEIEDVTDDGSGIGHYDGMAIFVKDSAVGDRVKARIVKVKKHYAFGRVEEIISESHNRVESACPVSRQCGGCTLQHIGYEAELELKKNRVINCLKRIGGIDNPEEYLEEVVGLGSSPERYRNKMQFPVGKDKDGMTVLGFYAGHSHSIIPVEDCMIGHEINRYIIAAIKKWCDENKISVYDEETGKGFLRHVLTRVGFQTGELMVCVIINNKKMKFSEELVSCINEALSKAETKDAIILKSVVANINTEKTNKILGEETVPVWGQEYITDYIGDVQFRISAQSFYQVNPVQTYRLYSRALEYANLTGNETVWDMYCGIGTISLFLAKNAKKVIGVEIVPQAIQDAKQNADLNAIKNAKFYVGKAEEVATELLSGKGTDDTYEEVPDVIVVDPPRKGCDEKLLNTVIKVKPNRMVYVSCDPATLARDLKILMANGFNLEKFSVFDQFSRSMHVECAVLMSRADR
ncbi:MAG: 23S rRNA (uracil(1939)-C(5))-methyltransferase RlmD [Eubacterium sp.]|nr:23S rRNA (uracil(1939)-C(5))-methyltransferase RlmD [Eubacterium sp.]